MRNDNLGFFFGATGHFANEALSHAADMGAQFLAISPSAYYGRILQYHPDLESRKDEFTEKTVELLAGLAGKAQELGVTLTLRNEYWSLFGGEQDPAAAGRAARHGEARPRHREPVRGGHFAGGLP